MKQFANANSSPFMDFLELWRSRNLNDMDMFRFRISEDGERSYDPSVAIVRTRRTTTRWTAETMGQNAGTLQTPPGGA